MNIYEIELPGFNGATDSTDDLILWVAAPTEDDVLDVIEDAECGRLRQVLPPGADDRDVDFTLPRDKHAAILRMYELAGRMLRIDYRCPNCGHEWQEEYTSACDSECGECGTENIGALDWEEIAS